MRQMTESERRRRENVRALLSTGTYRHATDLAKALGVTKGTLSQLIGSNPLRTISERTARRWEKQLGLPDGALDDQPAHVAPVAAVAGGVVAAGAEQIMDSVLHVLDEADGALPPDKYRAAVMLLYRLACSHGGTINPEDVAIILRLAH